MRILYVYSALAIWGGLERVLIEKMNYLADTEGYEVFIFTYDQGTHPFPFSLSPKVVHRDLNVLYYQQYRYCGLKKIYYKYKLQKILIERLKSGIKEIIPDIIVCPRVDLLGYILKSKGDIPLIFESHSSSKWIAMEKSGITWFIKQFYYNRLVKRVQMVVALTEGDAVEWRKIANNVRVIPNIVHLNNSGLYCSCQSKSAIFVGRVSLQKDIPCLLRIWYLVQKRFPEWQLHLYCERRDEPTSTIQDTEQMNANIYIHEPTHDIFDKYLEHSMLLLTSCYEPFGLVLPEAMSCGLPVISFDCPYGPADIISDGVDGFLIKNRNINDYVEKICFLIENENIRIKMGQEGILSSQRFKASNIMPQWIQLFNQLSKH